VTLVGKYQSLDISVSVFPNVSKLARGIPKTKLRHFYQPLGSPLVHLGLATRDLRAKAARGKQSSLPKKEPVARKQPREMP